jgi:hypothetical protein
MKSVISIILKTENLDFWKSWMAAFWNLTISSPRFLARQNLDRFYQKMSFYDRFLDQNSDRRIFVKIFRFLIKIDDFMKNLTIFQIIQKWSKNGQKMDIFDDFMKIENLTDFIKKWSIFSFFGKKWRSDFIKIWWFFRTKKMVKKWPKNGHFWSFFGGPKNDKKWTKIGVQNIDYRVGIHKHPFFGPFSCSKTIK